MKGRVAGAVIAAALVLSVSASAAAASPSRGHLPRLPNLASRFVVRPGAMWLDHGLTVLAGARWAWQPLYYPPPIQWSKWTLRYATGAAAEWVDVCGCGGTYVPHSVRLRAYRPRFGAFTRLAIYTQNAVAVYAPRGGFLTVRVR